MIGIAKSLVIAALVQLACQAFKLIYYSIRDRRFTPRYFVTAGGMLGRVVKVVDAYVTIEVATGTEITVQKSAITTLLPKGTLKAL